MLVWVDRFFFTWKIFKYCEYAQFVKSMKTKLKILNFLGIKKKKKEKNFTLLAVVATIPQQTERQIHGLNSLWNKTQHKYTPQHWSSAGSYVVFIFTCLFRNNVQLIQTMWIICYYDSLTHCTIILYYRWAV